MSKHEIEITPVAAVRVLIDFTQVPLGRMGVGSYAENLLKGLAPYVERKELEVFVVLQSDDPALRAAATPGVRIFQAPAKIFRRLPARLMLEQIYLPFLAWKHRIKVLHSLHYSFPFVSGGAKRVVTMHDMTSYLMPELHSPVKRQYMRYFIAAAVHRAEHLVFISHSAHDDTEKWFHRTIGNASVIHHGLSQSFRPNLDAARVATVKQKYGAPDSYILYLGTLEPRKNVNGLLHAFARLAARDPGARLVVAGKKGWYYQSTFELVETLGIQDRVVFAGYVDEVDKPYLISGATLFVYPSFYEGFGLPVLEAMACGIPTITSNISSMPEVAADGALLVDPSSLEDLSDALQRLYFDKASRCELRRKGLRRASSFSWEKSVGELIETYKQLQEQPRHWAPEAPKPFQDHL